MKNINKAFSYNLAPTFPAPNWKAFRLTITHLSIEPNKSNILKH